MRKHLVAGAVAAAVAGSGALALFTGVAQADPTFNQLLRINSHNVIAGYFGSGAAGHPNKGYLLNPPKRGQAMAARRRPPGGRAATRAGAPAAAGRHRDWPAHA